MNIINNSDDYQILFEDQFMLAVNKPAGMLSVPDRYNALYPNLRTIFDNKYGKIFVVHRLDRDTSGVMIFAKDAETHKILNDKFQNFKITKIYHALLAGVLGRDEVFIDIPLMPSPSKKGTSIPSARGKESYSKFKVLERFKKATYVEIELLTGRHHQIRAHAAAIGYPLLVDDLYGSSKEFFLSEIKKKYNIRKDIEEKPLIARITLHAYSLSFDHPHTGEEVKFTAELPKDFTITLKKLQKFSELSQYYVGRTEL